MQHILFFSFALSVLFFSCKKEELNESNFIVKKYDDQAPKWQGNDTSFFDINDDGQSDLWLTRSFDTTAHESSFGCIVTGDYLHNSTCLVTDKTGESLSNYHLLTFGETIDANINFEICTNVGSTSSSSNVIFPTENYWYNVPIYAAIRIEIKGKVYYGWFVLNHCSIQKVVLCKNANTAIKIGDE
jgi:hypothetical protein